MFIYDFSKYEDEERFVFRKDSFVGFAIDSRGIPDSRATGDENLVMVSFEALSICKFFFYSSNSSVSRTNNFSVWLMLLIRKNSNNSNRKRN